MKTLEAKNKAKLAVNYSWNGYGYDSFPPRKKYSVTIFIKNVGK